MEDPHRPPRARRHGRSPRRRARHAGVCAGAAAVLRLPHGADEQGHARRPGAVPVKRQRAGGAHGACVGLLARSRHEPSQRAGRRGRRPRPRPRGACGGCEQADESGGAAPGDQRVYLRLDQGSIVYYLNAWISTRMWLALTRLFRSKPRVRVIAEGSPLRLVFAYSLVTTCRTLLRSHCEYTLPYKNVSEF